MATGDFDAEYLEELRQMESEEREKLKDTGPYVTVTSDQERQELVVKAQQEIAEVQKSEVRRRKKTYLTSEIPVRPCTADCMHRGSCRDFKTGRVQDNELCKPELRQIKKWQVAFRRGSMESLKDDAGAVAGSMAVQINRLLEKVIEEGVVVESVKVTNSGLKYTEKIAHPALREATNILKTLGIDLGSFLMTPKAQKDGPPPVQVNIGITANEVQARFAARYDQKTAKEDGA